MKFIFCKSSGDVGVSTVKSHRGDNGWVSTVKSHRGDNFGPGIKKCKSSGDGGVSTVKSHRGDNLYSHLTSSLNSSYL
jgi:hypothetical protein